MPEPMIRPALTSSPSLEDLLGQGAGEFTECLQRGDQPDIEHYARVHPEIAGWWPEVNTIWPNHGLPGTWRAFFHDIFGNPFGPPPTLARTLLTPEVLPLARAAYENRTLPDGTLEPARLAVLADALEEAGSIDSEVLGHLRSPGLHWRGCFVVDALWGQT